MGKSDEDRVPTLTGINYLAWAQRMAALLIEKDLEDVNTTLLPFEHPPTGSPAPGDIPWAKKDRRAKAKIELRLFETHQRSSMGAMVAATAKFVDSKKGADQSITE